MLFINRLIINRGLEFQWLSQNLIFRDCFMKVDIGTQTTQIIG